MQTVTTTRQVCVRASSANLISQYGFEHKKLRRKRENEKDEKNETTMFDFAGDGNAGYVYFCMRKQTGKR